MTSKRIMKKWNSYGINISNRSCPRRGIWKYSGGRNYWGRQEAAKAEYEAMYDL